jgi:GAF domain-containing protein
MSCVTRLYAALSQVNQAIVWSETREELFEKVCEVLVEHGGFSLAWIGWHDPETERLIPKAQYGTESGHLESVPVNGDDKPARRSVPERRRSAIRCSMIRSRDHG